MRKVFILVALAVTAVVSASSASAATWTSNGSATGTGFTATSPAFKFTLSGIATGLNCTTSGVTGVLYGPSGTVGVNRAADVTLAISGCRTGGFGIGMTCTANALRWWVTGYSPPVVSSTLKANAIRICTMTVPSVAGCTIDYVPTGGINSSVINAGYNNTSDALTFATSGQAITAVWRSCGTWFGSASGSASATLTDSTGAALVYRITSVFVPNVTI